jgi:hypothetical protein
MLAIVIIEKNNDNFLIEIKNIEGPTPSSLANSEISNLSFF